MDFGQAIHNSNVRTIRVQLFILNICNVARLFDMIQEIISDPSLNRALYFVNILVGS